MSEPPTIDECIRVVGKPKIGYCREVPWNDDWKITLCRDARGCYLAVTPLTFAAFVGRKNV